MRASDLLGRFGGDEFVVIGLVVPPGPDDPDEAVHTMRRRLAPLLIGTYTFAGCSFDYPGASFGIVSVDPSVSSLQTVLKEADRLMYADKQARRAREMTQGMGPFGGVPHRVVSRIIWEEAPTSEIARNRHGS